MRKFNHITIIKIIGFSLTGLSILGTIQLIIAIASGHTADFGIY